MVTVNFGTETQGGSNDWINSGFIEGSLYQYTGTTGLQSVVVKLLVGDTDAGVKMKVALYDASKNKVAESDESTGTTAGQWKTFDAFDATLTKDAYYWIVWLADTILNNPAGYYYAAGSNNRITLTNAYGLGFPESLAAGSVSSRTISIYAEATAYYDTWTFSDNGNGTTDPTGEQQIIESQGCAATPDEGYYFKGWLLDDVDAGTDNPYTVTFSGTGGESHTLEALFGQVEVTISAFQLGSGSIDPVAATYYKVPTDEIILTATSASDRAFYGWCIDGVWHTDNPYTYTVPTADTVTIAASFSLPALRTAASNPSAVFPSTLTEPSTGLVTAKTNTYASTNFNGDMYNRAFYAQGLWWLFYNEMQGADEEERRNDVKYSTSSDGVNWDTPVVLYEQPDDFPAEQYIAPNVAFNGHTAYFVICHHVADGEDWLYNIEFNAAVPNSDGTLTWLNTSEGDPLWQVIDTVDSSVAAVNHPRIFLDKLGRPWITWSKYTPGIDAEGCVVQSYIDHSTDNSKTFTSAGGIFPYLLSQSPAGSGSDKLGVSVPVGFLSDNTAVAVTTAHDISRNGGAGNGTVFLFSDSALVNIYDLGVTKWIYPFQTNLTVTKQDRIFFNSGVLPIYLFRQNAALDDTWGNSLIELSRTQVVEYTRVAGNLYGFQIVYDPDFNRLYILGANTATTSWSTDQTPDVSMWIYDLNLNTLSSPYTFISDIMQYGNQDEYLESASLSPMYGDGHKFLFTISNKKMDGEDVLPYQFRSAVVDFYALFGETATPYPSLNIKEKFRRM